MGSRICIHLGDSQASAKLAGELIYECSEFPPSHPRTHPDADQTAGEHDPIPEIDDSRAASFRAPIAEAITGSSGSKMPIIVAVARSRPHQFPTTKHLLAPRRIPSI